MPYRFYRRWFRSLTLCKIGWHYFGWCRKTVEYKNLPKNGLEYNVCGACYAADPKPNGNKAYTDKRLRLFDQPKRA